MTRVEEWRIMQLYQSFLEYKKAQLDELQNQPSPDENKIYRLKRQISRMEWR